MECIKCLEVHTTLINNICPYCGWNNSDTFHFFYGGHLSQWSLCEFTLDKIKFTSTEQYMMYRKALLFNDVVSAKKILNTLDTYEQKMIGRQVCNFNEHTWKLHNYNIVFQANIAKFSQCCEHNEVLISTENKTIVEASYDDCIYGIGLDIEDTHIWDRNNWRGANLLGKILEEVRTTLKEK